MAIKTEAQRTVNRIAANRLFIIYRPIGLTLPHKS
jgi:hypothetical protein